MTLDCLLTAENAKMPSHIPAFAEDAKKTTEFQCFRVSGFQGFRVSGFQGFRVSGFQSFRVSEFQRPLGLLITDHSFWLLLTILTVIKAFTGSI